MSLSTRFPVAVHILAFLATKPDDYISSKSVSKSVATNPVAIRKILGMLAKAGLITSQAGIKGGTRLAKAASKIRLLDIYNAVEQTPLFQMHTPHPKCPLAKGLTPELEKVFDSVSEAVKQKLAELTLAEVAKEGIKNFVW